MFEAIACGDQAFSYGSWTSLANCGSERSFPL